MKTSVLASHLTPTQRKAVETVDRNVCVSAGAGTGKTRVLVERFLHLVEHKLAHPHEILAITFTEKAAQEMKRRIAERLRESGLEEARRALENAYIGTIHSFCARILREHPIEAGVDPGFRVLEEDEANLFKELAFEALVEARFQEPEIFNLLHVYGEKALRKAISSVTRKVHTSGLTFNEIVSVRHCERSEAISEIASASLDVPRNDVLKALEPLKKLKAKEEAAVRVEALLSKPISGWREIEALKAAAKPFQRRGDDQKAFRNALDEWLGFQIESLASGVKSSFLNFALDFEGRYVARKRERSGLDFDDLERQAVRLLDGSEPSQKAVRNLYQKHFKFIMVDEFQDTSPIQDRLINLIKDDSNLFIVGDWKQSIYGFRGADASLFFKKEEEFSSSGEGNYFSLTENFRSRPELLNQMNPFFEKLWTEEKKTYEPLVASRNVIASEAKHIFGEERQVLPEKYSRKKRAVQSKTEIASASFGMLPRNDCALEFLTIERSEKETVEEARIKEARVLAERIGELVATNAYPYRDFAMLFRAADDIFFYEYELRNLGIPYYVVSGRGFYHQLEIRDVISFLEVLDNPYLNIPLAAVLRSPLVQVTDDTLFWLANDSTRLKSPAPLYEALLRCEEIPEISDQDRGRLAAFRSFFLEFLKQKEKGSISETIELILERTRYDRYVLSLTQGKRHFANLRKLLEVARQLEGREPVHLGDFIRYVKGLETQEVREAEAQVEALEGNVVKLMTVHKAKGLEFKVVLLPDLNRKVKGESSSFLFDPEFGLGLKVFNEASRDFEKTASFLNIKEKLVQNSKEESKRLLYVGMTRACDHLILSGASKADEGENGEAHLEDPSNWYEWLSQWLPEDSSIIRKVIQTLPEKRGRISLPLAEHKKIKSALELGEPIMVKPIPEAAELIQSLKPIPPVFFDRIDLPVSAFSVFENDPEEYRRVYEIGVLPEETAEIEEWAPDEDEHEIKPAEFGTVIHKIFEYLVLDPEKAHQKCQKLIDRLTPDLDQKTREEIKTLSVQFLKSKLFSEIKNAKARYAEIPFVFRLQGGIIQGTLDLLYQTADGKWVILDYKTSSVIASEALSEKNVQFFPKVLAQKARSAKQSQTGIASAPSGALPRNDIQTLAKQYKTQLMLYALACHELLKIPVSRASLYFVRADQVYDFSLEAASFSTLKTEFESLQKSIIEKRKAWAK